MDNHMPTVLQQASNPQQSYHEKCLCICIYAGIVPFVIFLCRSMRRSVRSVRLDKVLMMRPIALGDCGSRSWRLCKACSMCTCCCVVAAVRYIALIFAAFLPCEFVPQMCLGVAAGCLLCILSLLKESLHCVFVASLQPLCPLVAPISWA